ncbi:N-acetyltransferase family protein [Halovenus marina]|uniref:GNAT family N-acetyltransferase n=1 Tax=Halovenus marina TaxID=3396621 RepID=UPI003F57E8C8
MVVVRAATPTDLVAIQRLHRGSIEALTGAVYDDQQVTAWKGTVGPRLYPVNDDTATVLVAERVSPVDDRSQSSAECDSLVGVGWVRFSPDTYLDGLDVDSELGGLYVAPSASREGVGTHLCNRLEAAARDQGCTRVGLWASLNAVPFYRSCGYQRGADRTITYDSAELPVVEMHKSLTAASDPKRRPGLLTGLRDRLSQSG